MIRVHNVKIDTIQDNSVVYISNAQADEMMFICEFNGGKSAVNRHYNGGNWTLYSKEYKHYSPAFDSLEEMKELLQNDWLHGEITDIDVFEYGDGEGGQS